MSEGELESHMAIPPTAEGARIPVPASTLPELFQRQVRATPDGTALLSDTEEVTFGQLNTRANRLAHLLIALGAGPERVVGVALPRSVDAVVAQVAVLKAGAVYLPLDPAYPAERTAFIAADANPVVLLTSAGAQMDRRAAPVTRLLRWEELDTSEYPSADPVDADRPQPLLPEHPLYLIYTSGSTGVPKGVLMPAVSLVNLLAWHGANFPVGPGSRTAQLAALAFDFSMHEVLSTLVHGRCLVIPREELRLDPIRLAHWLERHEVGQLFLTNSLLESLCQAAEVAAVGLNALTDIVQSGEALVLGEDVRRFLGNRPGLRVRNHYGATEMQDVTTWVTDSDPIRPRPTVGRPVWNTRVYVLDEALRPCASGDAGDVYVAGTGVARGYLNRPGLTSERFVADPFGRGGGRMYRTGDVARWNDDRELEFLGRSDDQVKVHGFRVEVAEITTRLLECPDVAKAVVVLRAGSATLKQLVAYVVPAAGAAPEPSALRAELARALPPHMVPAAVVIVAELPLSPNGKIDPQALPAHRIVPAGADAETPRQRLLMDVFDEVLGASGTGPDDDFFALGGDSIGAVRLVICARRHGLALSGQEVFACGTPRRLAAVATQAEAARGPEVRRPLIWLRQQELARLQAVVPSAERLLPVTPLQQGFLFHRLREERGVDAYAEQVVLTLRGSLDAARLRAAAGALLERHESLRAGFFADGMPRPVQFVLPHLEPAFGDTDLSEREPAAAAGEAEWIAERHRRQRFALAKPPLLRFHLIRMPCDEHRLAISYHHIILDGWSVSLLVRELLALYRAPGGLSPAPQFRDWLRELLSRDVDMAERAWRDALGGMPGPTVLAAAGNGQPAPPASACHTVALPAAATRLLTAFAGENRLTVNTIVQAAWGILLGDEAGIDDVVFGTVVSGRESGVAGVEDMVGLLINTVPVRVRILPDDTVLGVLRRLAQHQQRLAPHQHLGLGAICRLLGWTAEFDTLLVFENPALQLTRVVGEAGETRVAAAEFRDDTYYAISVVATPGRILRISLTYRPDLLSAERVRSLAGRLTALLTAMPVNARRPVPAVVAAAFAAVSGQSAPS
jgi:amino acid adenylation domain-containing protein